MSAFLCCFGAAIELELNIVCVCISRFGYSLFFFSLSFLHTNNINTHTLGWLWPHNQLNILMQWQYTESISKSNERENSVRTMIDAKAGENYVEKEEFAVESNSKQETNTYEHTHTHAPRASRNVNFCQCSKTLIHSIKSKHTLHHTQSRLAFLCTHT